MIARLTGQDWKTVAQKIKEIEVEKEYPKKKPHPRILDPYQEKIIKWLEDNLSGVRDTRKIQEEGVRVGYSTVKEYICQINANFNRKVHHISLQKCTTICKKINQSKSSFPFFSCLASRYLVSFRR